MLSISHDARSYNRNWMYDLITRGTSRHRSDWHPNSSRNLSGQKDAVPEAHGALATSCFEETQTERGCAPALV
jgi:hypothetical protein